MRPGGILKCVLLVVFFVVVAFLAIQILDINMDFTLNKIFTRSASSSHVETGKLPRYKCGLSKSCPGQHFAFKITSGAASVVGPKICLDDTVLMSAVKNNVGRGINIALANARTGKLIKTDSFDMWAGDVKLLINLLKSIEPGTLVLMATFDDPATKLNTEAKNLISELGSTKIHSLGFRDNWIFVGGKGLQNKSPFEQHMKNSVTNNKYDGWPEVLEMEGCIPVKDD